ncbi:MAG: hypothetical protein EOO12_06485, partial [Chitinophagaceae bacterium]
LGLLLAGCKDFKKTKGGMPYKIISQSGAQKVKNNEWIKFNYIVTITNGNKDSVLQSSYERGTPFYMPVTGQTQPYDLSEVLPMLHKGDSLIMVQSIDTFLHRSPQGAPPYFQKGGKLTTRIRVVDIFADQKAANDDEVKTRELAFKNDVKLQAKIREDQQKIQQFLGASAGQAQQTPSGVYVLVTQPGTGAKAQKGDFVDVYYTGRTINGVVFDSNIDTAFHHPQPLSFQLAQGQMLKGFDEAIQLLKKGDKARMLIPSPLAYGENPPPGGKIGPNEILVFDVELRSVSTADPRGAMPPPPPPAAGGDGHGH